MFHKKTLRDVDLSGQTVLVRTDYNLPLATSEDGQRVIASDFRLRASLPTIEYLLEHEAARIILLSHMGRPDDVEPDLSLSIVAERLAELLPDRPIQFVNQVTGPEVEAAVADLPEGGILLLENLRFDPREKAADRAFASEIVSDTGASLFVLDGFGVSHRAQASTVALAELLPAVAGLLLEKEVTALTSVVEQPERPFVVVIGGAKVADKEPLIQRFLPLADRILVGGKIAADGYSAPASAGDKIYVATDFDTDGSGAKLDIGPLSTAEFIRAVQPARTVLWNGVLGQVEDPAYATSSTILAKFLGENPAITSVICGGDTTGFVENLCADDPILQFSLISTGGGAALELLSGQKLPGVEALEDK